MSSREAYLRLGLPVNASEADVDNAFRSIARHAHPDRGGSRDLWDALQMARSVARRTARDMTVEHQYGHQLLQLGEARSPAQLAVAASRELAGLRRIAETTELRRIVIRRRTSRLLAAKRRVWLAATLCAAAGGLMQLLRLLVPSGGTARLGPDYPIDLGPVPWPWAITPGRINTYSVVLGGIVAVVGVIGLVLKVRADHIEHAVEDLAAELAEREQQWRLLEELEELSEGVMAPGTWWTAKDLSRVLAGWSWRRLAEPAPSVRDLARSLVRREGLWSAPRLPALTKRLGGDDTARLLIARSLETGVLHERWNQDGFANETVYVWGSQPPDEV